MEKGMRLFFSISAFGISAMLTQMILFRELFSVFLGNEITIGIIISSWLILTGLGTYLGRLLIKVRYQMNLLFFSHIAIAVLPIALITLLRLSIWKIVPTGSSSGIIGTLLISLAILVPYCLLSGMLLAYFCMIYSEKDNIGRVYMIDTIGFTTGGVLFSFVLAYFLNPIQIAYIALAVNLIAAYVISDKNPMRNLAALLFVMMLATTFINLNSILLKEGFREGDIIHFKDSLYGRIVVTKDGSQRTFYENGGALFSNSDVRESEEIVHFTLLQHHNPQKVLFVSGGMSAVEALKYDITRIDYLELDPAVPNAIRKHTDRLKDARINVVPEEPRLYVQRTREEYDAVIIDLPDPTTLQLNRFYTLEFFSELKRRLSPGAVVSISLSAEDNAEDGSNIMNSILYSTLKRSFQHVLIIPGTRNYFLASDNELTLNIAKNLVARNIANQYVNTDYLKGNITVGRVNDVMSSIDDSAGANEDLSPILYLQNLKSWLSLQTLKYLVLIILFALAFISFLLRMKGTSFALFTTGFSALGAQMMLILTFQILYGYAYLAIGLIVTMFMIGLLFGSYLAAKLKNDIRIIILLEGAVALILFSMPAFIIFSKAMMLGFVGSQVIISSLMILLSLPLGMQFAIAAAIDKRDSASSASSLFFADLAGSALGALMFSIVAFPLFGLFTSFKIAAALKIFSLFVLLLRK